ncbi:MAG: DegV family EDD domain-containing protein [Ruminococcus sp.]|nr:DegV family EDD domain-containing protein [Ruminococcus sp.]
MNRLTKAIRDENRPMQERLFMLLGSLALAAMAAIVVIGLITGDDPVDLMTISACFAVFLILMLIAGKTKKYGPVSVIVSFILIFVLMPVTFFSGGGIQGGAPMWFIFSSMCITMIVNGKGKFVLLLLNDISAGACCFVAYQKPELLSPHTDKACYIDSFISIVFVGLILSLMVGFEILTLKREKERSDDQRRKIADLNKAQSRFFSSMSHEIRTPINTIIGLDEMILREDISEEVADDARNIQSASKILLSLINDILDMSKIESGKMDLVPVVYDVGNMLSDIVTMISVTAEKKGLEFVIDVDPTLPAQLLSDEVRIKQILINLLNNAVKYTRAGTVSLSVHSRRTDNNRALVTYSIEDTGMGIRKESIPHLFDAFKRVDESRNRYIEGTGLGLSIVKQLCDLLGGEISVTSIYTKGSTFVFTLEQEIVGEQQIGSFSIERFRSGGKAAQEQRFEAPEARVLIVDDNRTNILVAEKLLRRTKVVTETAESGEECLRMTLQKHYDAIFMDHMMPVMDGVECLHAVRSQSGGLCRETPIVVLTANAGSEEQALYRREGFDAYMLKPIDTAVLEETLLNILPAELVTVKGHGITKFEQVELVRSAKRKVPLVITTESIADIPQKLADELGIQTIPYKIGTDRGLFDDGFEADGDVLIRCMNEETISVRSEPPSVADYEAFFAEQLSEAQHIIHISMARRSGEGFANASEAALAFYNVSVVDSGHLSSGMGLLAISAAYRMKGEPFSDAAEIKRGIEEMRGKVSTSFIMRDTNHLCRSGRLPERINRLCSAFMIHPVIVMKDSTMIVGKLFFGSLERARRTYIKKALHDPHTINTDTLFITYVGMKKDEIEQIRDIVAEYVKFDKVYLQKASPAICANCGEGTFGLLFQRK